MNDIQENRSHGTTEHRRHPAAIKHVVLPVRGEHTINCQPTHTCVCTRTFGNGRARDHRCMKPGAHARVLKCALLQFSYVRAREPRATSFLNNIYRICWCMLHVCIQMSVFVCVCVCVLTHLSSNKNTTNSVCHSVCACSTGGRHVCAGALIRIILMSYIISDGRYL